MAQKRLGIIHLANVPEELLSNILIRLPSKFVVRCKLVCKQWASLISDSFFVSSYVSRLPPSSSSWTVFGEGVKDRCIEYDLPKHICSRRDFDALCLSIDHERKAHQSFKVLGATDGMILFALIDSCTENSYKPCNLYYICNPAARKLISLSPPSPDKVLTVEYWIWGSGLVARVENNVLESFRVVLLSPDAENECLRFTVYASETRKWNRYIVPLPILPRHMVHKLPTALNQILHWLTITGFIIAYDPYAKPDDVRIIWRPNDIPTRRSPNLEFDWLCDASKGKLRYLERFCVLTESYFRVCFKVWVLEDYESGCSGSWRMSHEWDSKSTRFNHIVDSLMVLAKLVPMFFDPFDADILYLRHCYRNRLISYDVKTRKVEVVQELAKNKMLPRYFDFLVELMPWTSVPFS